MLTRVRKKCQIQDLAILGRVTFFTWEAASGLATGAVLKRSKVVVRIKSADAKLIAQVLKNAATLSIDYSSGRLVGGRHRLQGQTHHRAENPSTFQ